MNDRSHAQPNAAWLDSLRTRFVQIARRRVPEDAAEDVAHDAMRIVLESGMSHADREGLDHPPLRWCFMTLRNVIGNWYQKRRSHESLDGVHLSDEKSNPLNALEDEQRRSRVRATLDRLRENSADCANWLWEIARGAKPAELARQARIEVGAFYRRLYRCRKKLHEILQEEGLQP